MHSRISRWMQMREVALAAGYELEDKAIEHLKQEQKRIQRVLIAGTEKVEESFVGAAQPIP